MLGLSEPGASGATGMAGLLAASGEAGTADSIVSTIDLFFSDV